jgi:hypothetical protein
MGVILDELEARGNVVIGLEGFELDGTNVHPRLDLVYDADRLPGFPTAREAVDLWPSDVWVDVTLASS